MNNIIQSDLYRMRKTKVIRNTLFGAFGLVLFIGVILIVLSNVTVQYALMESASLSGDEINDLSTVNQLLPTNGLAFVWEILSENIYIFFFLPLLLSSFCADFSAGTYRNTLSYEDNRVKVYFSKLIVTFLSSMFLVLAILLFSFLTGSILFGLQGLSAGYLSQIFVGTLLQLPIFLSVICVGHCLVSFTKKSGATIASYLVGLIGASILVQLLAFVFPKLDFLTMLDFQNAGKMMANYQLIPTSTILFGVVLHLGIAAVATILGVWHYKKTDIT